MFKRILLTLTFAALVPATVHASNSKEVVAKIATSAVQTINKHPFICALIPTAFLGQQTRIKADGEVIFKMNFDLITWLCSAIILECGTNAIMKNFGIDPIA